MKYFFKLVLIILQLLFVKTASTQTLVPYLKANGYYMYVDSATMKPVIENDFIDADFFVDSFAIISKAEQYGYSKTRIFNVIDKRGKMMFNKGSEYSFGYINFFKGIYIIRSIYNNDNTDSNFIYNIHSLNEPIYREKVQIGRSSSNTVFSNYLRINRVELDSFNINDFSILKKSNNLPYKIGTVNIKCNLVEIIKDDKYGLADTTLNIIQPTIYDRLEIDNDGYVLVKLNKKYGFLNSKGVKITELIYDQAEPFSEGLALVQDEKADYFIDKSGKIILNDLQKDYGFYGSFHDGMAKIKKFFLCKRKCYV